MIYRETETTRLLRLKHIPNYPETVEQAAEFDKVWPSGLTHRRERPKTLRQSLTEPRK